MFYNTKDLVNKGCFNLLSVKGNDNLVLVFVTKDDSIIIPIDGTKSYKAYIEYPSNIELEDALLNFINTDLSTTFGLKKAVTGVTRKVSNLSDFFNIKDRIKPTFGGMVQLEAFEQALLDAGFDTSALHKAGLSSSGLRDYTKSVINEEAVALLESNAATFSFFKPNESKLPVSLQIAFNNVKQGKESVVLLAGSAGTGKSVAVRQMAYLSNIPVIQVQCTDSISQDDFYGCETVNTDPSNPAQFVFVLGPLLKAYQNGWWILIDEINMAMSSVINILNSFSDDTPEIVFKGKVYKRHPNFSIFCTMNQGYEGTNSLNAALKTRSICVQVDSLTQTEFVSRLSLYVKNKLKATLSNAFLNQVFKFNDFVVTRAKDFSETAVFCIRNAMHLCGSILTKSLTRKEFGEAVNISYFNFLSLDNDNSEQLSALIKNVDVVKEIDKLYSFYDYSEVKELASADLFSTSDIMFSEDSSPVSSSSLISSSSSSEPGFSCIEEVDAELEDFLNDSSVKSSSSSSSDTSSLDSDEDAEDLE